MHIIKILKEKKVFAFTSQNHKHAPFSLGKRLDSQLQMELSINEGMQQLSIVKRGSIKCKHGINGTELRPNGPIIC